MNPNHEGIPGAQSLYYYENLYPFFCHGPPVYISEEQPEPEPELFPFLALPGEIRNKIYRMCLVGPSIYSINLRFPLRRASSLLCVNKQIYYEAARIFYSGNVFRFPAVVLTSNSVQVMIENICGVRLETFGMMKRFILNIPVHSLHHGTRVVDMVSHNLDQILSFIVRWNGDNLLIQLNYELAWPVSVDPVPWGNIVCLLRSLGQFVLEKKMKIEVNLQTPFEHVEGCMDILHQLYDRDWSIIVSRSNVGLTSQQKMLRDFALIRFRDRYMATPGLAEYYAQEFRGDVFIFKPAKRDDGEVSLESRLFAL